MACPADVRCRLSTEFPFHLCGAGRDPGASLPCRPVSRHPVVGQWPGIRLQWATSRTRSTARERRDRRAERQHGTRAFLARPTRGGTRLSIRDGVPLSRDGADAWTRTDPRSSVWPSVLAASTCEWRGPDYPLPICLWWILLPRILEPATSRRRGERLLDARGRPHCLTEAVQGSGPRSCRSPFCNPHHRPGRNGYPLVPVRKYRVKRLADTIALVARQPPPSRADGGAPAHHPGSSAAAGAGPLRGGRAGPQRVAPFNDTVRCALLGS